MKYYLVVIQDSPEAEADEEEPLPLCLKCREPGFKAGVVYYLKYTLWLWMRR